MGERCIEMTMCHRYTKSLNKGTRRYMEDIAQIERKYDPADGTFFAIFDGHGGKNAAKFAKKKLWKILRSSEDFESEDPEKVKEAMRQAFLKTHSNMRNVIDEWPKRKNGMQSTSGTTATVALLRGRKLYVAQLGDSGLVLAKRNKETGAVKAHYITPEHKPDDPEEKKRINSLGGSVTTVNGVPRVVWKRPIQGDRSNENLRRCQKYEYIPFLAVSRALGDLWSYDEEQKTYIVSPEPDIEVLDLEKDEDYFMILASDGLWGVVDAQEAVDIVHEYEVEEPDNVDAADNLIHKALTKWSGKKVKADNISTIIVFFDQEPRDGETSTDDELSSGFTTVLEEDREETPPEVSFPSDVPKLTRTTAIRVFNFEEFAKRKFSPEPNDYVRSTVLLGTAVSALHSVPSFQTNGHHANLKRKISPGVAQPGVTVKRSRTVSEGNNSSPLGRQFVTDVSSKSLQSLKLDKDVTELSIVAQDFPQA